MTEATTDKVFVVNRSLSFQAFQENLERVVFKQNWEITIPVMLKHLGFIEDNEDNKNSIEYYFNLLVNSGFLYPLITSGYGVTEPYKQLILMKQRLQEK